MFYPPSLLNGSGYCRNLLHRSAWWRVLILATLGAGLNSALAEPTNTRPAPGLVGPISFLSVRAKR